MTMRTIKIFTDYKSPYAYLAKDLAYELERETSVQLDWLPFTLDIPSHLGSATLTPHAFGLPPGQTGAPARLGQPIGASAAARLAASVRPAFHSAAM